MKSTVFELVSFSEANSLGSMTVRLRRIKRLAEVQVHVVVFIVLSESINKNQIKH